MDYEYKRSEVKPKELFGLNDEDINFMQAMYDNAEKGSHTLSGIFDKLKIQSLPKQDRILMALFFCVGMDIGQKVKKVTKWIHTTLKNTHAGIKK